MQLVFYILASLAALAVLIAVPVLVIRALMLMARTEDTRRDLAELIANADLSLQHANRLVARTQEGVDRARHALERLEHVLTVLQPAATVGGLLTGVRRAVAKRREPVPAPEQTGQEGEETS